MIRWGTFWADDQGTIDYTRVRSFVSVILGLIGGFCAVDVIFVVRDINEPLVYAMIGALVLPLTGGKITDAVQAIANKRATAAVMAGDAPGRRTSDPQPGVTP